MDLSRCPNSPHGFAASFSLPELTLATSLAFIDLMLVLPPSSFSGLNFTSKGLRSAVDPNAALESLLFLAKPGFHSAKALDLVVHFKVELHMLLKICMGAKESFNNETQCTLKARFLHLHSRKFYFYCY